MDIHSLQPFINYQTINTLLTESTKEDSLFQPAQTFSFNELLQQKVKQAMMLNQQRFATLGQSIAPLMKPQGPSVKPFTKNGSHAFDTYIQEASRKYGIDEKLIHAV